MLSDYCFTTLPPKDVDRKRYRKSNYWYQLPIKCQMDVIGYVQRSEKCGNHNIVTLANVNGLGAIDTV